MQSSILYTCKYVYGNVWQRFMAPNLSKKSHHMLMGQRSSQALLLKHTIFIVFSYIINVSSFAYAHRIYDVCGILTYMNVYDLFSTVYIHYVSIVKCTYIRKIYFAKIYRCTHQKSSVF